MRQQTLVHIANTLRSFQEIPPHTVHAVLAALSTTNKKVRIESKWKAMLSALASDRRSIAQNMDKRSADMRPFYVEYLTILDTVREKMRIAATQGTPEQAHALALKTNEARIVEGKPPNGTNATYWATWVPPRIREDFAARLSAHYTRTRQRQGTRFTPFVTGTHRAQAKQAADNLRATIGRIRDTHASHPGAATGYTPYRALYLCAARMAEKALYARQQGYALGTHNTIDHPLPVNWLALLDAPMRERLRAAQDNPHAVTLDGLAHFYEPPRGVAPGEALPELYEIDAAHAQTSGLENLTEDKNTATSRSLVTLTGEAQGD